MVANGRFLCDNHNSYEKRKHGYDMSANKNWSELGEELKDTISDAILNGDFSNINHLINDTVNCAIDEAKKQTQNAVKGYDPSKYKRATPDNYTSVNRNGKNVPYTGGGVPSKRIPVNKVGKAGAILFNVFGGIGLGITAAVSLATLISSAVFGSFSVQTFFLPLVFFFIFGEMIHHGCSVLKRIRRAERYAKLGERDEYVEIDALASHFGKSKKYVLKDLHKMLELGMYPEGHLDDQKTCLILTNEMYKTYTNLQNSRKAIEAEEADKQKKLEQEKKDIEKNPELQQMITEGNECIKKLRELNDCIEGEVISEKLYRLENLLKEIFAQVKIHPEKMHDMHKLMNYYLPTTLKLVQAYSEFDDVENPGEDITKAKQQIENTLDTINSAFNELLNSLFRDKVYDVTTDAQVLQTMLSREGLVKEEFAKERVKEEV